MEYIYTALLLHKAGQKISEENVKKVLTAAGLKPDEAKVKALVSGLEGVNIDEAIKKAAMPVAVAAPATEAKAEKKEEKKTAEEEKKAEEAAASGLSALFG
ncbi:MAG: 50S ribosomal protein P1 [Candidatus Woesearchaeota archaeon]